MKPLLTTRRLWPAWNRFKSVKTTDPAEAAAAMKRLNHENKMLFGELLKTKTSRRNQSPLVKIDEKVKPKCTEFDVKEDLKMISSIENSGEMPDLGKLTVKKPRKRRTTTKIIPVTKKVNSSKSADSSDVKNVHTESCSSDTTKNLSLIDVDEQTVLAFPFINLEKEKYVADAATKMGPIKKLVDYHPDYASVSVILSKSMSPSSEANLERWKTNLVAKLGPEGFETFNRNQMQFGSSFRSIILEHLKGVSEKKLKITSEFVNIWQSVRPVFPLFSNIIETGGFVAHEQLKYKGLFDCLAVFRNEVMLVNWKKSDKFVPSLERTYDVPMAIAAYIGALNFDSRYPFRVEQAILVMAYSDGRKADVFFIDRDKCLYYWQQWLQRLNVYRLQLKESNTTFADLRPKDSGKIDIEEELKQTKETGAINQNQLEEKLTKGQDTIPEVSEKIDIDNELKSRVLVEESSESRSEDGRTVVSDDNILDCPLYNSEKLDHCPSEKIVDVKPSEEFDKCSYPSVTSILSETKSESAKFVLERWKRKMVAQLGVEGFEKYQKDLLEMGTTMHDLVRRHLLGEPEKTLVIPEDLLGCWRSLKPVFPLITYVHTTENPVVHPLLKYRGIIDCVAQFRNKLVIIDWKRSDKLKTTIDMTYDAPLQLAAYVGAVNYDPSYPYKVEEALLVIAYTDGTKADVFYISKDKCWKYWNLWLERLNKYRTMAYEDGSKITY